MHRTLNVIRALPCWQGTIDFEPLEGGITNRNYLVTDGPRRYVVRFGDDIPVHHILRFNELAASRAAYAAGVAPAVHYHQPGVMVFEYVNGTALTPERIREPDTLVRIVELLRRAHHVLPLHLRGPSLVFWVFHVMRDYAGTLAESGSPHHALLERLLSIAAELEAAAGPFAIVYGHNDLLSGNLLDDGERLWLIDWEYAGFNTPLFDLGGLASNNELDESAERRLLELYFGRPADAPLWYRYRAMHTASLLRETLWSMVSEISSALDVDYAAYTRTNLARFESAYERFGALSR